MIENNRHALLISLLLTPMLACGGMMRKPFTSPEHGGPPWTEVASPHFTLTTDLDREDAQRVSAELEAMVDALNALAFQSDSKPESRIEVAYFRRYNEYQAIAPKQSSGTFVWSGRHDFERTPIAVVYGDFVNRTRETFQHELTHWLVHRYYPQAPNWLHEGLASYFETLETKEGVAKVGQPSSHLRFWRGFWLQKTDPTNPTEWSTLVPVGDAEPASVLVSMSPEQFYGDRDAEPNTHAASRAYRVMSTHYAGARSLVYFLFNNASYQPIFDEYLQKLQRGTKNEDAWSETLGAVPREKLDRDYVASLAPLEEMVARTKYEPPPSPAVQVRALSDADVHVFWARVRPWDTEANRAAASADMNEALMRDPRNPGLALVRAYSLSADGKYEEAERLLRYAGAGSTGDARLLNGLGWVTLARLSATKSADHATIVRVFEPIAAKLARSPRSSAELDLLGRYHALKGDLDGGLAYERRATMLDASCILCLGAVAAMLAEKGRPQEALEVATFALARLPDGAKDSELTQQIAEYKRRATNGGGASQGSASKTSTKAEAAPPEPPSSK